MEHSDTPIPPPGMPERRRARRVPVVVPMRIEDPNGFSWCPTRDLSHDGVFFSCTYPRSSGSRLGVRLELPGEPRVIQCDGEVVVPGKPGVWGTGLRFHGLEPQDRLRLARFTRAVQARSRAPRAR